MMEMSLLAPNGLHGKVPSQVDNIDVTLHTFESLRLKLMIWMKILKFTESHCLELVK